MKSLASVAFALCALSLVASTTLAQKIDPAVPAITEAWARSTVPGATVSGAYMHIKSPRPLKLVKAESPVAGLVELHNMTMKDGLMEMKAMDSVDIPASKLIELKPGGVHVMLMMVKQPIKPGDKVPLILTFEGADKKPVVMKVDAVAKERDSSHQH